MAGKKKAKDSSSKFVGVYLDKRSKKWIATIIYKGKQQYLVSSSIEENAAKLYDKKSFELYHDIKKLNFPDSYCDYGDMLKNE